MSYRHLYFPPSAYTCVVRPVAQNVLIAHFAAKRGGRFGNLRSIIDRDSSTTGRIGNFTQPLLSKLFFQGTNEKFVEEANGVDLHIRFAYQALDFSQSVTARVVAAVGDDDNCLALIARRTQFGLRQVNGIEHRCGAAWLHRHQLPLQFVDGLGRARHYTRTIRKRNREILVVRVGVVEKFNNRCTLGINFVAHALADVEEYGDRERRFLPRKVSNFLSFVFFEEEEVLLIQGGNRTVSGISHGYGDQHHVHINVQRSAMWIRRWESLGRYNARGRFSAVVTILRENVHVVGVLSLCQAMQQECQGAQSQQTNSDDSQPTQIVFHGIPKEGPHTG